MTHKRSLVRAQYGPLLEDIEPRFTAGFFCLFCPRSPAGRRAADVARRSIQAAYEESKLWTRSPAVDGSKYICHGVRVIPVCNHGQQVGHIDLAIAGDVAIAVGGADIDNFICAVEIRGAVDLIDGSSVRAHRAASEDRHCGGTAGDGAAVDFSRVVLDRAAVERGRPESAIADGAAGLASRVLLEDALLHDYIPEPAFAAVVAFVEERAATFRGGVIHEDAFGEDRAAPQISDRAAERRCIARERAAKEDGVVRLACFPAGVSAAPVSAIVDEAAVDEMR